MSRLPAAGPSGPGASTCTPAVTTTSPVSSPCEITTVAGSYRRTSTLRRDTVWLCGSTTHTAGRPFASVSALAGISTPGGADSLMRPVTVDPSSHGLGRIDDADLDLERSGGGIRLGRHLPHATGGPHGRVVGESDLHHRIARARPDELLGHVEDGVASALTRELHNHLPGTDDFARFGADRGDRTRGIGEQDRVAQLFLCDAHLCLSGVDLGLGGLQRSAGLRRTWPGASSLSSAAPAAGRR